MHILELTKLDGRQLTFYSGARPTATEPTPSPFSGPRRALPETTACALRQLAASMEQA